MANKLSVKQQGRSRMPKCNAVDWSSDRTDRLVNLFYCWCWLHVIIQLASFYSNLFSAALEFLRVYRGPATFGLALRLSVALWFQSIKRKIALNHHHYYLNPFVKSFFFVRWWILNKVQRISRAELMRMLFNVSIRRCVLSYWVNCLNYGN